MTAAPRAGSERTPDDEREAHPHDAHPRRVVLRGLGWTSIGYPIGVLLLFLTQVLAARLLTRDGFGTYSLAVSIFTTLALVCQLGLPHSMLRRTSAALARGLGGSARNEIHSAFLFGTGASLVTAVIVASPLGERALDALFSESGVGALALVIGVRTGLRILENLAPEALRAFRDFLRVSLYDGLLASFLFVVVLAVLLVADRHVEASTVMWISVATAAVALVPAVVAIHRKLRGLQHERLRIHNPLEPAMWLTTVGRAVLAQLDLLIVGMLATSGEVATYAVPFRLALFVGFPLIVVNQVVPPLIASWSETAKDRLDRVMRSTAGLALVGSVVIAAVYAVAGHTIIRELFGAKYEQSYSILLILSVGQVVQTAAGSCGFALMMTANQRIYAWILGITIVVTAGLDVVAYDAWGLDGVALATMATLTVQNFVQAAVVRRRAGFTTIADVRLAWTEGSATLRRQLARRRSD